MSRIGVFGAGGRAGRAAVDEARRRDHQVTAVVRDPELAIALLDEIDTPTRHRTHLGIEAA